jgi:hypothetical protein
MSRPGADATPRAAGDEMLAVAGSSVVNDNEGPQPLNSLL